MSWKVVSIMLPEEDRDILIHLSSMLHSWTVDHEHNNCEQNLAICHASSHEYGASGKEDGTNLHQHFLR